MKRNYPGYAHFLPLMPWSDLATKTLAMMLASAQGIAYRTGRMARPGHRHGARGVGKAANTVVAMRHHARSASPQARWIGATRNVRFIEDWAATTTGWSWPPTAVPHGRGWPPPESGALAAKGGLRAALANSHYRPLAAVELRAANGDNAPSCGH